MSKQCQVTGKVPMSGNNVSKAVNKTRRRFMPNLHKHKFWVESENRFITLNISTKGLRIIDKKGIDQVLELSLIHISEPTRRYAISYAVF